VNVSNASVKNKVAVSRAAVSQADGKIGFPEPKERREGNSRRFFIHVQMSF
jgi:hypothetical protein